MGKKINVLLLAALIIIGVGCKAEDKMSSFEKIQKQLIEMQTYTATAVITQNSNKGSKTYTVIQHYEISSGRYRMEVTSPESLMGSVTIFNGASVMQHNPRVEGSLNIDLPQSQIRNELFLGQFVKNYLQSEGVAIEVSTMENEELTVLEAVIPGDHPYMQTEKLWVHNETLLPVKLVLYDKDENERIIVEYKDFEYNIELGEELFTIQ